MVSPTKRAALIDRYAAGYDAVLAALADITPEELDRREAPGEWSTREIVHHLADSEMIAAARFRRIIIESRPLIQGYDQDAFAAGLWYDRPIETSLLAFQGARASTVPILRSLTDAQWQRTAVHSETGEFSLEAMLVAYASHAHDHADQIRRARQGFPVS